MQTLGVGVDEPMMLGRTAKTVPFLSTLRTGRNRIEEREGTIPAAPPNEQEDNGAHAATPQKTGDGGPRLDRDHPHPAKLERNIDRLHGKDAFCDVEPAHLLTSAAGDSGAAGRPDIAGFPGAPVDAQTSVNRNNGGGEGFPRNSGTECSRSFKEATIKPVEVLPGSRQANALNEDLAGVNETRDQETDFEAVHHGAPADALTGASDQGLQAVREGEIVPPGKSDAHRDVPTNCSLLSEPRPVPTLPAETPQPSPSHSSEHRGVLTSTPRPYSDGRTVQTADNTSKLREIASEGRSSYFAARQGMDTARSEGMAAINSSAGQPATSILESIRPPLDSRNEMARNDTFAVLDSEQQTPSTTWTRAGAHHAEAGYLDPVLGWVGVRADVTSHGIQAAVVPGSLEAAQVLGGHLTGLNAHLAQHEGSTASVTLAPAQDGSAGGGWNAQSPSGGQGSGRHGADGDAGSRETATTAPPRREQTGVVLANPGAMTINRLVPVGSGSYISVLA